MSDTTKPEKSDVAKREEEVLAFWNERGIFEKSLTKDAPNGEFVFYDGPPFATGLPHHGHILAGTIKDTIPRYQTMRGKRVRRKWGWDCHGLPLENQIEQRLGLKTKKDIEEMGVEQFNAACRDAVLEYAEDWKRIIPRLGRWVDMENDYKTMDATYTESVWWVFHKLHEKDLVFEGFKSMHLCPRCGTTLSNFEVNQGYKDIKDIAVTVKLELVDEPNTYLLVWTTTPWTLPGNMAAAVNESFEYVKVRLDDEAGKTIHIIIAKERLSQLSGSYEVVETFKGKQLVGKSYVPPFAYFKEKEKTPGIKVEGDFANAWKIYHAPYVELGAEGTGAVHLAPAYGDEDMALAKQHNVPIVHHVGQDGRFLPLVTDFAGALVKPKDDEKENVSHLDADIDIVRALKEKGLLFKKENITHSYPHCWRCDTPLLNYATTSWFVRVTDIKDDLVGENNKIHWVPDHVGSARFGNWLEGARDWAVSRQRYWGAPLPIWRNTVTGEHRVFGSRADLTKHVKRSGNTYLLMRHGEAESNVAGVVNTQKNHGDTLTPRGVEQARQASQALKEAGVDLIFHSGFLRSYQTAKTVQEELGLPEGALIEDGRIGEIQVGTAMEGKTWAEYNALFPTWEARYLKVIEGVENRRDVQKRTGDFLYDLERRYQGKRILIVSHGGTLFGLECAAAAADIEAAWSIRQSRGYLTNAEVRTLDFVPLPHNRDYELDYHRPFIDEIELQDDDGTPLSRVPDVFDCWFESGSMPYGQQHYPFENTDVFDPENMLGYPADFIAEGLDQTRGWFYSLLVLGTALFDRAPFKNVIVNGLVLAEDGKKMSKSLKNYPDPMDVVDQYGADTLRFYLLSSPIIRGEDLNFTEKNVAELGRKNIGRLANVLSFYELYKDESIDPKETLASANVLDLWILSRLRQTTAEITDGMESYELDRGTRPLTDLIDDLSVWYLRRSRERVKSDDAADKRAALATLRYTLREIALLCAPSMPFFAEHLFQRVRTDADAESVHLMSWPEVVPFEKSILEEMQLVRDTVTKGLEARAAANIKVRQPLRALAVGHELRSEGEPFHALVRAEVNVKELVTDTTLGEQVRLDTTVTPELKREGDVRELIRSIQESRKIAGLTPQQSIMLNVAPETAILIQGFESEIRSVVGASDIATTTNELPDSVTIEQVRYSYGIQP